MKTSATTSGVTNEDCTLKTTVPGAANDVTTMNRTSMTTPIVDAILLPKETLSVGTLSTRALAKQGKTDLLLKEINRCSWDVIGLFGTHLTFTDEEKCSDATLILTERDDGKHRQGVGSLLFRRD